MESNSFTVTLSGVGGTQFFNLTLRTINAIKWVLVFITLLICTLLLVIYVIKQDASGLEQEKNTAFEQVSLLEDEVLRLNEHQNDLVVNLSQKKRAIADISEKLEGFESAFNLSSDGDDLIERMNLVGVSLATRHQMMQLIPNGPPVKQGYISSRYGQRLHPVKKVKSMHRGIDYAVNVGTPIYAPADGIVEVTRKSNKGSGNFLRLSHSFGFSSSYSHLKKFAVKRGDYVKKGDLIGLSGNTGLSTGYHLHYEIRLVGSSLDPFAFIQWDMKNFDSIFESNKDVKWDYLVNKISNQLATAIKLSSPMEPVSKDSSNLLVTSK